MCVCVLYYCYVSKLGSWPHRVHHRGILRGRVCWACIDCTGLVQKRSVKVLASGISVYCWCDKLPPCYWPATGDTHHLTVLRLAVCSRSLWAEVKVLAGPCHLRGCRNPAFLWLLVLEAICIPSLVAPTFSFKPFSSLTSVLFFSRCLYSCDAMLYSDPRASLL